LSDKLSYERWLASLDQPHVIAQNRAFLERLWQKG
jgi:hypothetical protein